ncbi:MAG TPA: ABC transporter substrate-binding protein [Methylomusa anaerophila]|uniref:Corrinoid ABC transporter substrate-binding protein n=1 Tax=Methylomusa anaerophila TaxID=1930071 RepID=A0A348AL84_9FIRM|nr:ABC transporter substrate-binding protein [Methylomusa anaerophila]BBB91832.1 corrinoid ABC transporter substrate-binding protein [Methylomusa anaerophila]HML88435.1 ABC transporter substrate-binding protein [Methylomusa anaerophila]
MPNHSRLLSHSWAGEGAKNRCSRLAAWLVVLLGMLLAAGCSGGGQLTSPPVAAVATAGYQVTDTQGNVLRLPQKPQRIITLSLSSDEIVLGLTQPERVVALHYLADDPGISTIAAEAGRVPVRLQEYNAEQILSLQPDLVIAPDWSRIELIQTLRDMGIPVFVSKGPSSVAEVKQAIREISQAIGEEAAGSRLLASMEAELAGIAAKVRTIPPERRQTLVLISHMAAYGGKGSLFDDMCGYAGVINGAAAAGLGKNDVLAKEAIIRINPDLMLLPSWNGGELNAAKVKTDLANDPALQTVKAIRTGRLEQVPDLYLYCASQDIVHAIRDIMQAAYPEQGD